MPEGRLPPVLRDALLVENDPEILNSYARGLWAHLQGIRKGGPSEGYPIETIKEATVWLITAYHNVGVPPAYEATRLVGELIKRNPRSSTSPVPEASRPAYYAAIQFEAEQPPHPTDKVPSAATLYEVAKHVRLAGKFTRHAGKDPQTSAESTISGWRQKDHYRENVDLRRKLLLKMASALDTLKT